MFDAVIEEFADSLTSVQRLFRRKIGFEIIILSHRKVEFFQLISQICSFFFCRRIRNLYKYSQKFPTHEYKKMYNFLYRPFRTLSFFSFLNANLFSLFNRWLPSIWNNGSTFFFLWTFGSFFFCSTIFFFFSFISWSLNSCCNRRKTLKFAGIAFSNSN